MEAKKFAVRDKWGWLLSEYVIVVLGVITALAAQQSVQYFHDRHQLREARDAIAEERAANQHEFATTTALFRRETMRFQTNLAVLQFLQQHPGAARDTWPGKISWHCYITKFATAAWQSAQHLGVTARMGPAEVRQLEILYYQLSGVGAASHERLRAISAARRYTASDSDPSRLTGQQLANEIELAEAVLIAHYRFGGDMRNLHAVYPEFTPSPNTDELGAIVHEAPLTDEERRELSPSNR
jgi:type II secretory pathway pseudopilin PulG